MGMMQRSGARGRLVGATALVAALTVVLAAPAGAAAPVGRVRPPGGELHANGVQAFAGSSPYNVTSRLCGDTRPAAVPAPYSTLFAYGADGGDNAHGD
jgi:hypothetical protein